MPATRPFRKTASAENLASTPQFADDLRREKLAHAFPDIRRVFHEYQESQHIPGLAFGVVIDGELAFADAFGVQDVDAQIPAARDSVFRIASMSKSFVAMAILLLRDKKKLSLVDPVSKYIPEFKRLTYPTSDSPAITLRDLLTMSPGFPEDNPWGDRQMSINDETFTHWLRAGIPFANAPGVTFEYSNYGYAILGRIVTLVAGTSFQNYTARTILKPLGMNSTYWDKRQVPPSKLVMGYRHEDAMHKREEILGDGAFAAMAGLFTTVPDFARYMAFLMDAFPPRDDDPAETRPTVSRATRREMQQLARFEELVERRTRSGNVWRSVSGYGYGLAIWHDELIGYGVSHGGGLPGYGSYYYLLPEHGVGVVAFGNKTYSRVGFLFPEIFELLSQTGGLQPRKIEAAPVLVEMQQRVRRWLDGGDDAELTAYAADNFLRDRDMAHRCAELERIHTEVGGFVQHGELKALNALRGKWTIECERGRVDVFLTLAPTMPPTLQMLTLTVHSQEE